MKLQVLNGHDTSTQRIDLYNKLVDIRNYVAQYPESIEPYMKPTVFVELYDHLITHFNGNFDKAVDEVAVRLKGLGFDVKHTGIRGVSKSKILHVANVANPATILMRNSFFGLLALNFRGFATMLDKGRNAYYNYPGDKDQRFAQVYDNMSNFIYNIGGTFDALDKAIKMGYSKKALFGQSKKLSGLGVVSEAMIAAAGSVITALLNYLKSAKAIPEDTTEENFEDYIKKNLMPPTDEDNSVTPQENSSAQSAKQELLTLAQGILSDPTVQQAGKALALTVVQKLKTNTPVDGSEIENYKNELNKIKPTPEPPDEGNNTVKIIAIAAGSALILGGAYLYATRRKPKGVSGVFMI